MAQRTRHRTAGSKGPIGMSVGDAVEVCEHLQLLPPLDCIQGSCHPLLVLESLSELPEPRLPIVSGLAAPNILDPHYLQEAVTVWVVLHSIAQLPRSQRIGVYTKHGIEYRCAGYSRWCCPVVLELRVAKLVKMPGFTMHCSASATPAW